MRLLVAAGDPLSDTLSGRVAQALPSLHTSRVSTPEAFVRAIESKPFEIVVVRAELLQNVERSRRALLAESEVILVAQDPREAIRFRADDFVIDGRDTRGGSEELLIRVATALHRLDRRIFAELPTPELLREALSQADALSPPRAPSPPSDESPVAESRSVADEESPGDSPARRRAFD
ncbi:MAG TPA: hypothetical protein VKA06_03415, partial [Spirochaetia bacterium]|nr:hypothetical protein [Spirochaetia bacterium]